MKIRRISFEGGTEGSGKLTAMAEWMNAVADAVNAVDFYANNGRPGETEMLPATVAKAVNFVEDMASLACDQGKRLRIPDFGPCSDGTIDLHWEQETWALLVNIKVDDKPATFFGAHADAYIKGSTEAIPVSELVLWLLEREAAP